MVLALRVRSVHNGVDGGPYLTTMVVSTPPIFDTQDIADIVTGFWNSIKVVLVGTGTVKVNNEIEVFDAANGQIQRTEVSNNTAVNYSSGTKEWSAKQGLVALRTADFVRGRRVQGRLFIPAVPSNVGEQVPNSAYLTQIQNSTTELISSFSNIGGDLAVWSRPSGPDASDGSIHKVQSAIARPYYAVLRSRRQ